MIRVLLVDDNPGLLNALVRLLRNDFDIVSAEGGIQALNHIREEPPFHVLVTDVYMPGMDGIELVRRVNEESPTTMCILMTGAVTDGADAIANGSIRVFASLMKPFRGNQLAAAIVDAVNAAGTS